ncbi:MAG: DNA polymerase III subunit beta [Mariprofundaceae bacterium]
MKVSLPRFELFQALQRCQSVVERRHTVPILSNVLIEAVNDELKLTATDMEVSLQTTIKTNTIHEGSTTVSARKIFDIVKELPDDAEVELSLDKEYLHIKSSKVKLRLATQPADGFPALQQGAEANVLRLDGQDLASMIASIGFAMSSDETRKYLTGALFEVQDSGSLRLVATDGHRLAIADATLSQPPSKAVQVIVPRKAVGELRRLCEEVEGQVELFLGEQLIRLSSGEHTLTSKLIDARFPTYMDVIPTDNPHEVALNRRDFDRVLRRAMVVANEFSHDVRLQLNGGEITISAHNTDHEEAEETLDAEYSGPELAIGFNGRYLREAIGAMQGDTLRMQLKDNLSPVLLLESDRPDVQFVIMPMRI